VSVGFDVSAPPVAVLRGGEPLRLDVTGGSATAIAWPGVGSHVRSMHRLDLAAGGRTAAMRHDGEAVYFVAEGSGRLGGLAVGRRTMAYVPARVPYTFEADEPLLVYGGPCPPDLSLYGHAPEATDGDPGGEIRLFDAEREGEPLPMIGRNVRLVVWPGTGARIATMNFAILEPGEENQPHAHAESDDTIAILAGEGTIDDLDAGESFSFVAGDVVFVRAGVTHKVKADRGVEIVSAGGPCPPDTGMLRALGLM
jgi:quercetin dioxygenase-like cupin family protein